MPYLTMVGDHHRLYGTVVAIGDLVGEIIEGLCVKIGTEEQGEQDDVSFHTDILIKNADIHITDPD